MDSKLLEVLLIEDNPSDSYVITGVLDRFRDPKVRVQSAETLNDGLSLLSESSVDIILLDLNLPDSLGLETLHSVIAAVPHLPVIVLTVIDDVDVATEAVALGAQDYLIKGKVDEELFFRAVRYSLERKRSEQALRESEERYRGLMNGVPAGIFRIDALGQIVDANQTFIDMFGFVSREALLGESILNLFILFDDTERVRLALSNENFIYTGAAQAHKSDGKVLWIEGSARAVRNQAGEITYYEGAMIDVTERKIMEAAEREQRSMADALADTAATINNTLEIDEVMESILVSIGQVVNYDTADIMLLDSGSARIAKSIGYEKLGLAETIAEVSFEIDKTPNLRFMKDTLQTRVIPRVSEQKDWISNGIAGRVSKWIRSYAGAPVVVERKVIGFININNSEANSYDRTTADKLKAFADQAAIALHNAQLYQGLEKQNADLENIVQDATKKVRQQKDRLETILNHNPDPILLLTEAGTINFTNAAFVEFFGCRLSDAQGRSICTFMREQSLETCQDVLKDVIQNQDARCFETNVVCENNKIVEVEMSFSPINDNGEIDGIVCTIRDISSVKHIERMKDAFVSSVSHELRTPITALKLNQTLLKKDPDNQDIYLERIDREIIRLNNLIEDLLRLSRLDQGKVKLALKPLNLNTFISQYSVDRRPIAESKGIELIFESNPEAEPVLADEGLLSQALSALLTNAINYTPEEGHIRVYAQNSVSRSTQWSGFCIEDDGPGIPEEDKQHLFERFFRGKIGRESGEPGTGLGLSIANEIVDRHSGWIEVRNRKDGPGAQFMVWLPTFSPTNTETKVRKTK